MLDIFSTEYPRVLLSQLKYYTLKAEIIRHYLLSKCTVVNFMIQEYDMHQKNNYTPLCNRIFNYRSVPFLISVNVADFGYK